MLLIDEDTEDVPNQEDRDASGQHAAEDRLFFGTLAKLFRGQNSAASKECKIFLN